jgi:hypothetical protein
VVYDSAAVEAKDDNAVAFYQHHGFQRFASKPQALHPDDLLVDMATGEVHVKQELNPKDSRMLKGLGLKR